MPSEDRDRVQEALVRSASELINTGRPSVNSSRTFEQRLSDLAQAGLRSVPGAHFVGLTMRGRDGILESHAATSPELADLDALQVSLDEGPCRDAVEAGTAVLIEVADFAVEQRWPRFSSAASGRGMRGLMSFAMAPTGASPGAVNFYSRGPDRFGVDARSIAGAFAMQAAVLVYGADRIANLEHALSTRDTIGQAKGILMHRHRIDEHKAFDMLIGASQESNLKLHDVARWLISDLAAGGQS